MAGADVRVCFIGDSYVAGYGDPSGLGWVGRVVAAARERGLDLTGYNLGIRGADGPGLVARFRAETTPRLTVGDRFGVVVGVGVNDAGLHDGRRRAEDAATLDALSWLSAQCTAAGWALLVVGPAPIAEPEHRRRVAALAARMARRCQALDVAFIDTAALGEQPEWVNELTAGDGLHPARRGYQLLAELLAPDLTSWLDGWAR